MIAPTRNRPSIQDLLAEEAALALDERRHLLASALGKSPGWLFAHSDHEPEAALVERYRSWVQRRRAGEPVAYIEGKRAFWTLELLVNQNTLIPRPDTELLVERALSRVERMAAPRILDLGTGSGAVALAIAAERPDAEIVATDQSDSALLVAAANARASEAANVRFVHGCWYEPIGSERFDLIVSNPPYLAADDEHLERGDLISEPRHALVAGPTGMEALELIISSAFNHLESGGCLAVEHGWLQQPSVLAAFRTAGFSDTKGCRDLGGQPRVVDGVMT